jgi:hypothetical protein
LCRILRELISSTPIVVCIVAGVQVNEALMVVIAFEIVEGLRALRIAVEIGATSSCFSVSMGIEISSVSRAYLETKWQVRKILQPDSSRMPCRHVRSGEAVWHCCRETIHAVASRRKAHEIHAVRVDKG